jgi:hypothetical protein
MKPKISRSILVNLLTNFYLIIFYARLLRVLANKKSRALNEECARPTMEGPQAARRSPLKVLGLDSHSRAEIKFAGGRGWYSNPR